MKLFTKKLLELCCKIPPKVRPIHFLLISVFFLCSNVGKAQSNPNEAEWNGSGYSLKKVVSNTTIPSGVNFSYTILFSAPAGATNITIADEIPTTLVVVNVPTPALVNGVTPTVSITGTPGVNQVVTYNLSSLPPGSASSGSFTIVVKFPEGTTCNGTAARNRAKILVNDWQYTPFVSTTATAADPWKVVKSILSGPVVNPSGGSCGYLMEPGDTVTYRLAVLKNSPYYGNVTGQQNMTSAVVSDILPPGAIMLSSTCGIPANSTGTITWQPNSGTLDAANPWAYYYCDITVYYPAASFPSGTINNQITLTGTMCGQQVTHTSNQTCIELGQVVANPSGYFQKYISLTNRVPGCTGIYTIVFCNNGNVPLSAFNIDDNIPSGVSVDQVAVYGGNATTTMNITANSGANTIASGINSSYFNSGALSYSVNDLQLQMTGSLPVGACIYLYVYFTVEPNPTGTIVTNCATFNGLANSLSLPQACVSFTVEAGEPDPCILKEICSPQTDYEPGDIIRFRLRVQNIGSADIQGANIMDNLNSNFIYVGNESYYIANTYNPACSTGSGIPSGTTAWTGVVPNHTGNNLDWSLPDIPSDCQSFYVAYCGYYGTWGLPYYFIEFDVMVDSMALPGVTPNNYDIYNGNLVSTETSNTVNVLVVASFGQEVTKEISTDNGANYSSSGTTSPGGTVRYRLNYKNTSNVPVSSVNLVDLLPRNDGTNDWLILNRSVPRGSQFDVAYNSNHSTSLMPVGVAPTPALTYTPGLNVCLPAFGISLGCTPGSWGASPDQNIRMNYGSFSLAPNVTLKEDFDVLVSANALNQQTACNDFAAISTANFLLNGVSQSVALTPIAAPPVCVTIDSTMTHCCDSVIIERVPGADGVIGCCARVATKCDVDSVVVNLGNGTISAVNWSCGNLPSGFIGQSSYTFVSNGCTLDMTTCIEPDQSGVTTAMFTIYFSNGEICEKTIDLECVSDISCCDSIEIRQVTDAAGTPECCAEIITKCEVDSIQVSVTNGTFSSNSWNCSSPIPSAAVGQSSFTFVSTGCIIDMINCISADQSGVVTINYLIFFANGEKCEKVIEFQCKAEDIHCCDSVEIRQVTDAAGTPECCAEIITKCEVDSIQVSVTNGTFSSNSWNCSSPIPSAAVGQSSFTFVSAGCAVDMVNCISADQSGVVTINYLIFFANGEKCEKVIEFECKKEESPCCPIIDFKLKQKWPHFFTQVGTFSILNPDPTSPICSVSISASPAGTFTTGTLIVDGVASSQSWNSSSIPASGNLSPAAVNSLTFSLVSSNYKGIVTVCIKKCDGTECCYDFKWNSKPYIDVDISLGEVSLPSKLFAVSINPNVSTDIDGKVKYVSFGMSDEQEVTSESAEFFAVSATAHEGDEYPENLTPPAAAYMSKSNVFFELPIPKSAGEDLGAFNLVFSKMLPKLGCALFDEEGNVIFAGEINVSMSDTLKTSVFSPGEINANMFEFLNVFPNPSDGNFTVKYAVGTERDVEIRIINPLGQVVKILDKKNNLPGIHSVQIENAAFSDGLYRVVLISDEKVQSKSIVLNR